jgi:cell division protein FtsB
MTHQSSQHLPPPASPGTKWRTILFVFIALCVVFVASYSQRLLDKSRVTAETEEWQARIEHALDRQLALQSELREINSPAYVDRIARQELDMVRPGDKVLVIIEEVVAPVVEAASVDEQPEVAAAVEEIEAVAPAAAQVDGPSIWQQWLTVFIAEVPPLLP